MTGIVDYGAMAVDTPAGDLGRLLGDFSDTAPNLFDEGLSAYRRAGGPLDVPDEFVRRLATTGALCSLLGWLVRLFVLREPVTAPDLVAQRINLLLARVERLARI